MEQAIGTNWNRLTNLLSSMDAGGCLYKGVNRAIATFTAGALAIGIHWIASKSGENMELIIRSAAVFILGIVCNFFREHFLLELKKS